MSIFLYVYIFFNKKVKEQIKVLAKSIKDGILKLIIERPIHNF